MTVLSMKNVQLVVRVYLNVSKYASGSHVDGKLLVLEETTNLRVLVLKDFSAILYKGANEKNVT